MNILMMGPTGTGNVKSSHTTHTRIKSVLCMHMRQTEIAR